MNVEAGWLNPEMITKRRVIAPLVALEPAQVEFYQQILPEGRQRYTELKDESQRPFREHLDFLKQHLQQTFPYPISAGLLAAVFVLATEGEKFGGTAADVLTQDSRLEPDMVNHIFAHNFDMASGVLAGTDRVIIVEDELHGLTAQRIERRNQLAKSGGFSLTPAEYTEVYGESTAYARESANLFFNDDSVTPGIKLFADLIDRVRAGQFVPGILSESFRELVVLGLEDAMEVYRSVYRYITV